MTMAVEPTASVALDVAISELPAQDYLGRSFSSSVDSVGRNVQDAFSRLYARIAEAGFRPTGPPFLTASQPVDGVMRIEVGAPCRPVPEPGEGLHAGRLEGGRAAVVLHRGRYDRIGPLYGQLFAWVARHGYRQAGAPREVYLNGPGEAASPDAYLTELVIPIV